MAEPGPSRKREDLSAAAQDRIGTVFELSEVREHYAVLAPRYEYRANAACAQAYRELVQRVLGGSRKVLEIGSGSSAILSGLPAELRVGCDVSLAMVVMQPGPITWDQVVADGQQLPFRDSAFDGIYSINVAEHVPHPRRLLSEAARVLRIGGRFLVVTPNGDMEWLLKLLEQFRMKLPEGPHRFIRFTELSEFAREAFHVLDHRRFLALPLGHPSFVHFVDRIVSGKTGRGLFQYILLEKRDG
jgi:ubiquinone/menaquinone biosynthesis C-methylase UbiE